VLSREGKSFPSLEKDWLGGEWGIDAGHTCRQAVWEVVGRGFYSDIKEVPPVIARCCNNGWGCNVLDRSAAGLGNIS